jgi:diketogulonate reductase-like aldo/keto reductase
MAGKVAVDFQRFAMLHEDVEAVIQRCGLRTVDCLLIDVAGNWMRAVFPSKEAAEEACRDLEVRFHEGWDDIRLAQRMNRRDHWGEPGGQRRAL